jgi:hypothetical protein
VSTVLDSYFTHLCLARNQKEKLGLARWSFFTLKRVLVLKQLSEKLGPGRYVIFSACVVNGLQFRHVNFPFFSVLLFLTLTFNRWNTSACYRMTRGSDADGNSCNGFESNPS